MTPPAVKPAYSGSSAAVAILASGGLDSTIRVAELARGRQTVCPLYVRGGLFWEDAELACLRQFLGRVASPSLQPLVPIDLPVADLYGDHWSTTGNDVPDEWSPDQAVFLPGRNVLLLAKAMLWCHLRQVPVLEMGHLQSNPFPDASSEFLHAYERAVNQAVVGNVRIAQPYAGLSKVDVLQRGKDLPLELTMSCLRPAGQRHCGRCNKCAERKRAFALAKLPDPTIYRER
jgi:7-cyano-7-deazaguanine synthase